MNGGLTCFGVPVGNETGGLLWMVCYIIAGLGKYVSVGVFPEFPISSPALLSPVMCTADCAAKNPRAHQF